MLQVVPVLALVGATFQTPSRPLTIDEIKRTQGAKREIDSILLVTGDAALIKRARKEFHPGSTAELARFFPASRFEIVPWGESRRFVIDRTTGPLALIGETTVVDGGFLRQIAKRGVMDVAAMTPEEYGAAKSMFVKWPGAGDRPSIEPAALGLGVSYQIRLRSRGQTRKIDVHPPDPRKGPMTAALRDRFVNGDSAAKGGLSAADRAVAPASHDELAFVAFGGGLYDVEPVRLATEAIRDVAERMRREADAANQRLLRELGYALTPGTEISKPFGQMPKALQNEVYSSLRDTWKYLGFDSQADALDFYQAADSFEVWTMLGLREMIDPGDPIIPGIPSGGSPTMHATNVFARVSGAYLP